MFKVAHYPDSEQQQANAKLISAAPNLLEACKMVLENLADTEMDKDEQAKAYQDVKALRAAIAKAEGKL